jgi:hypothetical protein
LDPWKVDPKKEPRKLMAFALCGAAIGVMIGDDLFKFVYDLFGIPWPGR